MSIFDLFFPKSCLVCGSEGQYICRKCVGKVGFPKQLCPNCGKPSVDGVTHIRCFKKQGLDGSYSVWNYEGVIRKGVLKLKYKFAQEIADELSFYMAGHLIKVPVLPKKVILTPIPLYWFKENVRGFNQSDLVGQLLAEKMGWGFNSKFVYRKKMRKSQTQLKGEERKQNIRGVFAVNKELASIIKSGISIVLFDDVYTTGSTIKEAGKVLKKNGAEEVWGLTIAK